MKIVPKSSDHIHQVACLATEIHKRLVIAYMSVFHATKLI